MIVAELRQLSEKPGYRVIVETVIEAIASRKMAPGEKLPPQRDLAQDIGVAVATVGRAYNELEQRGFVASHVGRGTFVIFNPPAPAAGADMAGARQGGRGIEPIELGTYRAPLPGLELRLPDLLRSIAASSEPAGLLGSAPTAGLRHHREAVAIWSRRFGIEADPEDLVLTNGGQHAVMAALSGLTEAGTSVATEELTDPRMKAVAHFLGRKLIGVGCDAEGMIPAQLDATCQRERISALYITPRHQNPTNVTMPAGRRAAIVAVARAHGLKIIESNIYGTLDEGAPLAIRELAPERSYYISSFGRILGAGMKVGWIVTPPGEARSVQIGVAMSTGVASPLMVELAYQMIANGKLAEMVVWQRAENETRLQTLRGFPLLSQATGSPTSSHVWLKLPEPWRAEDLVEYAARDHAISIASTHTFVVGRRQIPHAVRLVIGAPSDQSQLFEACAHLEALIRHDPRPSLGKG
ncbi:MAG: PLP-dependent aminotransferase family protein [Amaricoccus sp.]|uniref:aminotransferase-like domain-containing protein n=1 Tax=Amaricoccus sp. TaxID=1872485 RepID=UPI0039E3CB77